MTHLTPTRRAVIRTAAWSVPAVTVAAAAPAFAASPPVSEPNLTNSLPRDPNSTDSFTVTPHKSGTRAVLSAPYFVNTGDAKATGLIMTISSSQVISAYNLQLPFGPPATGALQKPSDNGITVTGEGTKTITVSFDLPFFGTYDLEAGGSMPMFVRGVFDFADALPGSIDFTVAAKNGGEPGAWTVAL